MTTYTFNIYSFSEADIDAATRTIYPQTHEVQFTVSGDAEISYTYRSSLSSQTEVSLSYDPGTFFSARLTENDRDLSGAGLYFEQTYWSGGSFESIGILDSSDLSRVYFLALDGQVHPFFTGQNYTVPLYATQDQYATTTTQITNGPYAPGETIDISSFPGVSVSEVDRFVINAEYAFDDVRVASQNNDVIEIDGSFFGIVDYRSASLSQGIKADLAKGLVSSAWNGEAFTDTINAFGAYDFRGSDLKDVIIAQGDPMQTLYGAAGDDLIVGAASIEENFSGGAGDDLIIAGGFQGAFSDYSDDVFRLYQAALGRAPDVGGHTGWARALEYGERSLEQVAGAFVASAEFQATYGALDDPGFVTLLYQNVLGREASADELSAWLELMDSGLTRANVLTGFSQSPEFTSATASAAAAYDQTTLAQNWTDEVYRLYRATLDREPDVAGFVGWGQELGGGMSYLDVASGFIASQEFENTYGALDDAGFVALLYQNVLGREADAAGQQGWLDALASGAGRVDIVRGFAESVEFITKTEPDRVSYMQSATGIELETDTDYIEGGLGNDTFAGGLGIDYFSFYASDMGVNTVLDFETWDRLELLGFGYADGNEALGYVVQDGAHAVFSDQDITIVLENTQLYELSGQNFEVF